MRLNDRWGLLVASGMMTILGHLSRLPIETLCVVKSTEGSDVEEKDRRLAGSFSSCTSEPLMGACH